MISDGVTSLFPGLFCSCCLRKKEYIYQHLKHIANDILLSVDTPVFATSSNFQLVKSEIVLQRETQMMTVR